MKLIQTGAVFAIFASVSLSACSPAPEGALIHDPYEAQNRRVHAFNKSVNEMLSGSDESDGPSVPEVIATPISNFADNVGGPGLVLNGLLQGDIGGAATNAMRFVLNTTVGIGGLFDPAEGIGIREEDTDFAETLAVWGVNQGAYIEAPILGPTTQRRLFGKIVDSVIDPLGRYGTPDQIEYGPLATLAAKFVKRDQLGGTIDSVLNESADSYAAARSLYLQNRQFELGIDNPDADIDPYADLYGD